MFAFSEVHVLVSPSQACAHLFGVAPDGGRKLLGTSFAADREEALECIERFISACGYPNIAVSVTNKVDSLRGYGTEGGN